MVDGDNSIFMTDTAQVGGFDHIYFSSCLLALNKRKISINFDFFCEKMTIFSFWPNFPGVPGIPGAGKSSPGSPGAGKSRENPNSKAQIGKELRARTTICATPFFRNSSYASKFW